MINRLLTSFERYIEYFWERNAMRIVYVYQYVTIQISYWDLWNVIINNERSLPSCCRNESTQATSREDDLHQSSAGCAGGVILENEISRHLYARGGCPQDQPARVASPGNYFFLVFFPPLLAPLADFIASKISLSTM